MKKTFLILSFWFLVFSPVQAAVINFSVADNLLTAGEILVALNLDTEGQDINVVAGEIVIPASLKPIRILDGDSVLKFWIEPPQFADQRLTFAGMIPGGSSSARDSEGLLLFKFVIQGKLAELTQLSMNNLTVLLNDGEGTKLKTQMAWRQNLSPKEELGTIPPENFAPVLGRDPSLFNNDWFLAFLTQDKQSGVDYYEVSEGQTDGPWSRIKSPYRLHDQSRRTNVYIRAVDRSGNIRLATVILRPWYITLVYGGILIIVFIFILWFIRLIFRKLFWRSQSLVS